MSTPCKQEKNIQNLQNNQNNFMAIIEKIDSKLDGVVESINQIKLDLAKNFLTKEEAKTDFANKWVEVTFKKVIWISISALIGGAIALWITQYFTN